jgi:hypothetical protein
VLKGGRILKKLFIIFLLLIQLVYLVSCKQEKDKFTVENLPLSGDEQQIANLTSDIVEKFSFEKDRVYDIKIYLYQKGLLENNGGVFGIETKGETGTVLISGRKDGNISFAWNISAGAKYQAVEIDDDRVFMRVNGIGQEKFVMEEGKEYVLVFVGYKEGASMSDSLTEIFYIWDTIEDKAGALGEFDYAYILTTQLSGETGYK